MINLKNILVGIEEEVNGAEYPQKGKAEIYSYIDKLIIKLLGNKLQSYSAFTDDFKLDGTNSNRYVELYEGVKPEKIYTGDFKKNKANIKISYKIKLKSIDIQSTWSNYKNYTPKEIKIENIDSYDYDLEKEFEKRNAENNEVLNNKKEKLMKSKNEFVQFLKDLKQSIINNEDIKEVRKTYDFGKNGIPATTNDFENYLKDYDELIELLKLKQD